ncbi:MAG TPA: aspartyl protease family protein [Acidobacteriaceae bacterium]|nr:aspartyl protease family protein [Acidobacteriaceae bacterium]
MPGRILLCSAAVWLFSAAHAHAITCNVRTGPKSPADIAMSEHDYAKAESLYAAESEAATGQPGSEADRLHAGLIRAELRQSKTADAEKDAIAWSTARPKNSWALVALGEVQWREGEVNDTLQTLNSVRRLDYCNPQAHADLATIYRMSAMYASANSELTLARKLDPIDDQIERDWLRLQPRADQLSELTRYLDHAAFLPDDERRSLERRKERLSEPPASGCRLVTPVASTAIPFRAILNSRNSHTYWGLDVEFNGKHRALEIDTGASGLILTHSAANALHLTPDFHFKAGGIGDDGDVDSFVAKVASIKIGSLEFQDCDVEVLSKTPEGMLDQDGLIGGDVFSHFLFTLDFPGRILKLDPLPARPGDTSASSTASLETGVSTEADAPQDAYRDASMKDWDRVFRSGHQLIMPVQLKQNSPWKLFILDTGSQMDLISPDAAREVSKVSKGSWVNITGISGEVKKTWTTGPMTLYFSHLAAPNNGMLSIDTSRLGKETGVEISGFIGAPTLHQLTMSIDYRDNLVHFTYDPKRIRRCMGNINIPDCY